MSLQKLTAIANAAPSATTVIVPSVAGRVIRVVDVVLNCGTATNVVFLGSGTNVTPTYYVGSFGGFVMNYNEKGWFNTVSGQALTMTTNNGGTVGVLVGYTYQKP